ncbi:ribosomal large subunit pseudouridine synthase F [Ferrimonas sediminum]|uniref:Pseudouridine synthase n=1 Tax=Ferrimonas sediminum TaxID=718193 RepID=A0A1G8XJG2_9GAMM|nr:23S rRNA pseudouridine(2604) synthase RluF [Ferrimonas sediminum]SDJ90749.1 ribosomal large subunit pseudouridine synthase F [Ferrimonas sediminum]
MTTEKRLNKFISESGFCSRREADKLIEQNRVTINGRTPELGTKVLPGDQVAVDGKPIKASASNKSDRIYIAYNKPIGITCTTERDVHGNIVDAIGHKRRIFPIGRLDKPSEGLIFLTSDGDIVNKILRAENAHDKEYVVTVDQPVSERFIERMSKGVPILDTVTKPCQVTMVSRYVFKIVLTQGLNRQIRRMCEYLGYKVTKLKRTRIMNVTLSGLRPGQWRDLSADEMAAINQAVAGSSKTAVNTTPPKDSRNDDFRPARPIKPRSGAPRRPSGQGEGRGALDKPSGSGRKIFVDNPNKPKVDKPKACKPGDRTLSLKRKAPK